MLAVKIVAARFWIAQTRYRKEGREPEVDSYSFLGTNDHVADSKPDAFPCRDMRGALKEPNTRDGIDRSSSGRYFYLLDDFGAVDALFNNDDLVHK